MQDKAMETATSADRPSSAASRDMILALLLAVLLSASWALRDWSDLSRLLLPDPDDMMRLAQVRDWLAGQSINDWTQYRMAPPAGAPMHWSRVNDAGIAALIVSLSPLVGRHGAELATVLLYPALLFAAHLFLSQRLARRIWGADAAPIALILGALAYPGTTVFAPGRIDHHALQVVVLEIAILACIARPTFRSGVFGGATLALGLVIGLETVPQTAGLLAVLFAFWVVHGDAERTRLAGVATGLAAATLPFVLFLRPTLWSPDLCDAFTPASSNATFAGAALLGALALATPLLPDWRRRTFVGGTLGIATLVAILSVYPTCLTGPYGQVDPFLIREFFPHIDEANSVLAQASIGRIMQLGGLMFAAMAGVAWVVWRRPRDWRRWLPLAAPLAISGAVTLAQVRGAYLGAPISAALLAGVILSVRRHGKPVLLVATWLGASGTGWYTAPMIAEAAMKRVGGTGTAYLTPTLPRTLCNTSTGWAAVDRYPPGIVMASIGIAADLTGATRMSTVGAGYHRNNRGNMALYRYFLSPPDVARTIARDWRVRYVAFCPRDFEELDVSRRFPDSVAALLNSGRVPADLRPLPLRGTSLRLYRLAP